MYWVFAIGGYLGALLTAFYAFRIVFRVTAGDPVPEAEALERGEMAHGHPMNPATHEPEDADVGFPGPEHHIAEREWEMKVAMGVLGFLALFAGLVQIPGVDDVIHRFLAGSFEGSKFYDVVVPDKTSYIGMAVGGTIAIAGIAIAALFYLRRPGTTAVLERRLKPLHTFLFNKWYFDELIDALVVKPIQALGRFFNDWFERYVIQGLVNGTAGVARGANVVVRIAESGYVRSYALLLVTGFAGLALYFLVSGS
jgi:NADH-quinone oxidoreductase subunit L